MSTANLGNILLDKDILLESGTNEVEVLVFSVADFTFGINVAKVREVLPATHITSLPKAHSSVRGVFKLRDLVVPCVSLIEHLGIDPTQEHSETTLILADFNRQQTAFLVDGVEKIHRLSWENILAVPPLMAMAQTPVTAVARVDGRLIVMLDFEMVIDQVTEHFFRTDRVENLFDLPREELRVVLADDSPSVRQAVGETLRSSGYTQLNIFENGAAAWDWIERRLQETGRVEDVVDLLISDVEMPLVDGFHLTKRIKEHAELGRVPVLLYSSIVTSDNHKKGEAVGADAQVAKPDLAKVVELADQLIVAAQERCAVGSDAAVEPAQQQVKQAEQVTDEAPGQAEPAECEPATTDPSNGHAAPDRVEESPAASASSSQAIETDGAPAVDARLFATFRSELSDHLTRLDQVMRSSQDAANLTDLVHDVLRSLHTIKSAASVVPLEPVAKLTHAIESELEKVRDQSAAWPENLLHGYLDCLMRFIEPGVEIPALLTATEAFRTELSAQSLQPA